MEDPEGNDVHHADHRGGGLQVSWHQQIIAEEAAVVVEPIHSLDETTLRDAFVRRSGLERVAGMLGFAGGFGQQDVDEVYLEVSGQQKVHVVHQGDCDRKRGLPRNARLVPAELQEAAGESPQRNKLQVFELDLLRQLVVRKIIQVNYLHTAGATANGAVLGLQKLHCELLASVPSAVCQNRHRDFGVRLPWRKLECLVDARIAATCLAGQIVSTNSDAAGIAGLARSQDENLHLSIPLLGEV
mmetsp:Transcript_121307/g.288167  ORF Transcript_121307/g.288167 Transcript_121307/m.288167 type:complete len:243 (-) Transcript_121307:68-796(-)